MDQRFMRRTVFSVLTVVFLLSSINYAQDPFDGMPRVLPSSLLSAVRERVQAEPKLSPEQIAGFANDKLASDGFEFEFDPCDAKSTETQMKYPANHENDMFHIYEAVDLAGKKFSFLANQPNSAPCGCWMTLPLTSATKQRIVVVAGKGRMTIRIPDQFLFESVELVDASLRRSRATWLVPYGGPPSGVSTDGKKLYIEIQDTPLFLEVSIGGGLRMVPRTTTGIITTFTDLKKFPKEPGNDYLGFRRFKSGRKVFNFKFTHVCA
jgi:hypothetical protein